MTMNQTARNLATQARIRQAAERSELCTIATTGDPAGIGHRLCAGLTELCEGTRAELIELAQTEGLTLARRHCAWSSCSQLFDPYADDAHHCYCAGCAERQGCAPTPERHQRFLTEAKDINGEPHAFRGFTCEILDRCGMSYAGFDCSVAIDCDAATYQLTIGFAPEELTDDGRPIIEANEQDDLHRITEGEREQLLGSSANLPRCCGCGEQDQAENLELTTTGAAALRGGWHASCNRHSPIEPRHAGDPAADGCRAGAADAAADEAERLTFTCANCSHTCTDSDADGCPRCGGHWLPSSLPKAPLLGDLIERDSFALANELLRAAGAGNETARRMAGNLLRFALETIETMEHDEEWSSDTMAELDEHARRFGLANDLPDAITFEPTDAGRGDLAAEEGGAA